jgi:Flp pilus assembly protein TadG
MRMILKSNLTRRTCRPGVAAVEMAFLLPSVLVPLLFGMWEMGRLIQAQQVVANAVREGGRTASTGQFTSAQVQTVVLNYLQNGGISTAGVTPVVTNLTRGGDVSVPNTHQLDQLQVSVTVPYSNVQWMAFNYILPAGTNMNASITWMSMANVPLTVSQSIPAAPL